MEGMSANEGFFLVLRRKDVKPRAMDHANGDIFERVGVSLQESLSKNNISSNENTSMSVGSLFEMAELGLIPMI